MRNAMAESTASTGSAARTDFAGQTGMGALVSNVA